MCRGLYLIRVVRTRRAYRTRAGGFNAFSRGRFLLVKREGSFDPEPFGSFSDWLASRGASRDVAPPDER
jgi:hypothetical protein